MANREEWPVRVFENPQREKRKFSRLDKLRHDMAPRPFIRMDWFTLVDVNPEDIPWAEPSDEDMKHTGRAGVVRATWAAIGAAGGLAEDAPQAAIREWDGKVQVSNGVRHLLHWGDGNEFTGAVFAESESGRVAMGVRSGTDLAIPEGLILLEQIPPKEVHDHYPDAWLAG